MAGVVIVEQESGMRITLQRILVRAGYRVAATGNPAFALDVLVSVPFPVVALVDVCLTGESQSGDDARDLGDPGLDDGEWDATYLLETLASLRDDDLMCRHAVVLLSRTPRARLPAALGFAAAARGYPLVRLPPDIGTLLAAVAHAATELAALEYTGPVQAQGDAV